jgi:hypothetical protein
MRSGIGSGLGRKINLTPFPARRFLNESQKTDRSRAVISRDGRACIAILARPEKCARNTMRCRHIYVIQSGGRWTVKLEDCNVVRLFDRKAQAVRAAAETAEETWTEDGVPTRVRMQVAPGQWEDARAFGGEDPLRIAS